MQSPFPFLLLFAQSYVCIELCVVNVCCCVYAFMLMMLMIVIAMIPLMTDVCKLLYVAVLAAGAVLLGDKLELELERLEVSTEEEEEEEFPEAAEDEMEEEEELVTEEEAPEEEEEDPEEEDEEDEEVAMESVHMVDPVMFAVLHVIHVFAPVVLTNVRIGQGVQAMDAVVFVNVPAGHDVHVSEPVFDAKVPWSQLTHVVRSG